MFWRQIYMQKQKLELENAELKSALERVNTANEDLSNQNKSLTLAIKNQIDRMRVLQQELSFIKMQVKAKTEYNDDEKYY